MQNKNGLESECEAIVYLFIPLLYLFFSPLIAYFEDDSAASNIFELAYDVTWSKEYEEYCKKI